MNKRKLVFIGVGVTLLILAALAVPVCASSGGGSNEVSPGSPNTYRTGDTIHYVLKIWNTGDYDAVLNIWDVLPSGSKRTLATGKTLRPGQAAEFEIDYTVRSGDVHRSGGRAFVINKLRASGTVKSNPPDRMTIAVDKTSSIISPDISVAKTVDFDGDGNYTDAERNLRGETAKWKIVVRNTGDGRLKNVTVSDSNGKSFGPVTLDEGESQTFTYSAVANADTNNTATAKGRDSSGHQVGPVDDSAKVTVEDPGIHLDKTASEERIPLGGSVTYTFKVTNTGAMRLIDIRVEDDKLGHIGDIAALDPGASASLTKTTTLQRDTRNVATAVGKYADGREVSDDDAAFVAVFLPFTAPDLELHKTPDRVTAKPGETVTYTLKYKNVGKGEAAEYTVVDDYDERYVTVIDANGGTVAGGKISWFFAGPLRFGESGTITYKVKIKSNMPTGTTNVDNFARVTDSADPNHDNDTDSARVKVSRAAAAADPEKPADFLPYTGGDDTLLLTAAAAALLGMAVRAVGGRRLAADTGGGDSTP